VRSPESEGAPAGSGMAQHDVERWYDQRNINMPVSETLRSRIAKLVRIVGSDDTLSSDATHIGPRKT